MIRNKGYASADRDFVVTCMDQSTYIHNQFCSTGTVFTSPSSGPFCAVCFPVERATFCPSRTEPTSCGVQRTLLHRSQPSPPRLCWCSHRAFLALRSERQTELSGMNFRVWPNKSATGTQRALQESGRGWNIPSSRTHSSLRPRSVVGPAAAPGTDVR